MVVLKPPNRKTRAFTSLNPRLAGMARNRAIANRLASRLSPKNFDSNRSFTESTDDLSEARNQHVSGLYLRQLNYISLRWLLSKHLTFCFVIGYKVSPRKVY